MPNPDRLSALDASFLALETGGAHMHVGSCLLFAGAAPSYDETVRLLESRLHLVPRYRQKLAEVPFGQGRPVWIDDPHFKAGYHVRHTALPDPADLDELRTLVGRVFSQQLDRSKPLWEVWLVEAVAGDRFALITKTHHALVDGISGVDIASVLFDLESVPAVEHEARAWHPRPAPSPATLLAEAIAERIAEPLEAARDATRNVARVVEDATGIASLLAAGNAPPSPLNRPIGPHRRFTWVDAELARLKAVKAALGGTVNDVVLSAVTGALRQWLVRHGHPTEDLTLKAMVPVSVRADSERGALGNRVATMYAPLPIWADDPVVRHQTVREAMAGLKQSGQAVGADALTRLAGFAPPTLLAQAARLQSRQRFFNLTVTNVPGPQFPLYLCGRRLLAIYPQVPLARNTRLGIAVLSYDGGAGFGLVCDYDALPDLELIASGLREALDELGAIAGAGPRRNGTPNRRTRPEGART